MDNQAAQAVLMIVIVLIALAVGLSPVLALLVYIIFQNSKRKRIYARILSTRADVIGDKRWFRARYASQPRFDSWIKIMPWEGAGLLVVVTGSVLFLGETNSGTPLTLQFAPGNSAIHWLGKCPFPNGAISWLRIDTANQKHYLSSETGLLVFGSDKSTRALFNEATRSFAGLGAPNS
jgi:hypothetical protein